MPAKKILSALFAVIIASLMVVICAVEHDVAYANAGSPTEFMAGSISDQSGDQYLRIGHEFYYENYSSNGISWDAKTKTLTLNNANLSPAYEDAIDMIYLSNWGTINVVLKGKNVFNNPYKNQYLTAISTDSNIVVSGSGSMECKTVAFDSAGNINIKSGTISSTGAYAGILSRGKITVAKAAKISVVCQSPSHQNAIYASKGMSNSYTSLVKISGCVAAKGAEFKASNGIYVVNNDATYKVSLKKWLGGKKVDLNFNKLNGYEYFVSVVKSNAFNNSYGKKVTRIKLGGTVSKLEKNALNGTKSMTKLDLSYSSGLYSTSYKNGKFVIKAKSGALNSKSFSGAGKNKKLTVNTGYYNKNNQFKTFLKKYGLSNTAKVKL